MEEHASIPDATGSRDLGLGLHNSEPFFCTAHWPICLIDDARALAD
jgi:hypothetical protein